MGIFRSVSGQLLVELNGADVSCTLKRITSAGIAIYNVVYRDDLSVKFVISKGAYKVASEICEKKGDKLKILRYRGLYWKFLSTIHRPVLLIGLGAMLFLALYLPTRVLFVEVEGNQHLPERMILEAAESSGIRFGTSRRKIRSEQIKNNLLDELPSLRWAGVNTYGCRAVITVKPREMETPPEEKGTVSSVIAARDGIISSCTVSSGNGLCTVGQAVREGDVLISGFTDCGLTITATRSQGEIMATTMRNLDMITPKIAHRRTESDGSVIKFSLVLGKKRINFYKGSGISCGSCVKMSSEYVLTLPGGFQLPVKLIKQHVTDFQTAPVSARLTDSFLHDTAAAYLKTQMIAGAVDDAIEIVEESENVRRLKGRYICTEMIGIERDEMIGDFNGKSDGADRERRSGG